MTAAGVEVLTLDHRSVAVLTAQAADANTSLVVTSSVPGVGKTYSAHAAAVATGRRVFEHSFPGDATANSINAEILAAAGIVSPLAAPVWHSTAEAVDLLDTTEAVLVVDNAHRLTAPALEHCQLLHTRSRSTLVLVGGAALANVNTTHPELLDRFDRWIEMQPLGRASMLEALARFHPLFVTAPPDRLADLDRAHAKGRWRRWAQLLTAALDYLTDPAGPLDDRSIDHALTALRWDRRPDPFHRSP